MDPNLNSKPKTNKKIKIAVAAAAAVLILLGAVILIATLAQSSSPAEFKITERVLHVSGMYGRDIPLDDTDGVRLVETPVTLLRRNNGSSIGNVRKGYFSAEGYDNEVYVNLTDCNILYIEIDGGGQYCLINRATEEQTRDLYESILEAIGEAADTEKISVS